MFKKILLVACVMTSSVFGEKHLGTFGAWHVIKSEGVCFASSQPEKSTGKYSSRGDVYLMVSFRPKEKVAGEFSTVIGYTFKKGSIPQVSIDTAHDFELFTQGDAAWSHEDQKLIEAMKKGNQLTLEGISSRGTKTTDTYSLTGFSKAYEAGKKACKM